MTIRLQTANAVVRGARLIGRGVHEIDLFVRIHLLFFSGMLPLLGAATVRRSVTGAQLAGLIGIGLSYHVFAYVLNDVIDLPIDRGQPLRQRDPLVRGAIKRWQALLVALSGVPVAMLITARLGGGVAAYATLSAAFVFMTAYNLWGKRCPIPPITDLVQGLGWGSTALYAGWAMGDRPNVLTWIVAAYAAGFILFINGIHGGIRDLDNDFARGGWTTAMFLGARPVPGGRPRVPAPVWVFAFSMNGVLIALGLAPLLRNDFGYADGVWKATLAAVLALDALGLALLPTALRPHRAAWNMAFRAQMFVVLFTPVVVFGPFVSGSILAAVLAFVAATLLPMANTYRTIAWLWQRTRSLFRRPRGPAFG